MLFPKGTGTQNESVKMGLGMSMWTISGNPSMGEQLGQGGALAGPPPPTPDVPL
jgi:hypothetical protein